MSCNEHDSAQHRSSALSPCIDLAVVLLKEKFRWKVLMKIQHASPTHAGCCSGGEDACLWRSLCGQLGKDRSRQRWRWRAFRCHGRSCGASHCSGAGVGCHPGGQHAWHCRGRQDLRNHSPGIGSCFALQELVQNPVGQSLSLSLITGAAGGTLAGAFSTTAGAAVLGTSIGIAGNRDVSQLAGHTLANVRLSVLHPFEPH